MPRIILVCLLALALEPLKAQDKFIAPNEYTVIPLTEQSNSDDPVHVLYVSNNSTVPIVLFGITLSSCENVRQSCGSRRTKIRIDAGRRANVGRVEARDKERAFSYRWAISYHADSSDAKVVAMLGDEKSPAIEKTPWRPARLEPLFGQTSMPKEMRDSLLKSGASQTVGDVLVRFAVDTAGAIIPESVTVLESPSGQLSAKVCTSVMSGDAEPAKNKAGHPVQTWVQTPVRVNPF